jgi:hypothetical protein
MTTKKPAAPPRGWDRSPNHPDANLTPKPENIAAVYRQLRKALEDDKNEPGAADFYYGEMEMRRHEVINSPWERGLLRAYWMLSGYGLRASRALGWLLVTTTATVFGLMLWGVPVSAPQLSITGHLSGRNITLTNPSPRNPSGPLSRRLTAGRANKALQVALNTDVFRAPDQDLTTAGTYTSMASRVIETILAGLAILAVRNRVKR